MDDETPTDPKENPTENGHLPVSGEVGVGPVQNHDPVTADTSNDDDHVLEDPRASYYSMNPSPDQMT